MTEAQITRAVIAHWKVAGKPGSLVASLPNMGAMGQYGLTKGLPDLLVLAPGLPVGFIELKSAKGKPTAEQLVFANLCQAAGVPHRITFGRDEPIRVLEEWGVVRRAAA